MILVLIGFVIYKINFTDKLIFENGNNNQEVGKTIDISSKYYMIEYPKVGNRKIDKYIAQIVNSYKNKFKKNQYSYINYESFLAPDNNLSLVFIITTEKNNKILNEKIETYNFNISTGERLKHSYIFVGDYKSFINNYLKKYIKDHADYKDCNISILSKEYNYKYILNNKGIKIYFDRLELCSEDNGVLNILIPYEDIKDYMNINYKNKTNQINAKKIKIYHQKYKTSNELKYVAKLSNEYKTDNENSKLINTIFKGQKVRVLEKDDEWSKVKYHGKIGYIKNSHLTQKTILYDGFKNKKRDVYSYNNVDIHITNDINSTVLKTLKQGEKVKQLGISKDGWSEIEYKDGIAFVYTTYLTDQKFETKKNNERIIDTNKPVVALTFDDGPNPSSTNRLLDVLEKNNAVATFFDLGMLMTNYSDIVKREEKIGCEVGSHTFDHKNLNKLSANEVKDQVSKSEEVFMNILGHKPTLFRPPYGNANDTVKQSIPYPLINWNVDTLDWKSRNKDEIINEMHKVDNYDGKIILMHSIYESTADAVSVIVPELISKGYQLVTISELASAKGITLKAGEIYYGF